MSRVRRDIYRRKLDKVLARARDEDFLQMVWATDALQSDRAAFARPVIAYPADAATSEISAPKAIRRWELETLACQLLITPKAASREGKNRITNCAQFVTAATATNYLRSLEDAESGIYLERVDVVDVELPRIGHREFPWQRGYLNAAQFYRYAYIYGQGDCAAHFERTYGLTFNEFSLVGFGLYAALSKRAGLLRPYSMEALGVRPAVMDAALALLSIPGATARTLASSMVQEANERSHSILPVAYQPSVLRKFPILSYGDGNERLRAPLRDLLLLRITAGVYYDLVGGGGGLRNEASGRFEAYCARYTAAMLPRLTVERGHTYELRGNVVETPDVFLKDNGEVVIAIECKATKLTFAAQYADDPVADAKREHDEIAKGVFQLWRYFSHARRGLIADARCRHDARGIVLTLDTWLVMSRHAQTQIFAAAEVLASADPEITPADRRRVIFCNVQDWESVLSRSDEDAFLHAVMAASEERFLGWTLPNVHHETEAPKEERRFPFDLNEVLPWWGATAELRAPRAD
jgi:hypothetical protein